MKECDFPTTGQRPGVHLGQVDVLQAALEIVQTEVQDVRAGLELCFHSELLGKSEKSAGVLQEGLVQGSGAVAVQELLAGCHIHELHLHAQKGIGIVDLQDFISTQTTGRIWMQSKHNNEVFVS